MSLDDKKAFKVCVVIPVYNHCQFVLNVFQKISKLNVFCLIINDGSDKADSDYLRRVFSNLDNVQLMEQFPNKGKGSAVRLGLMRAYELGFSHVLQVDADGQHNLDDAPLLLDKAKCNPKSLITGVPQYDESVPKGRLYSRYITHFWVWVETLSFDIQDSMCGFRVYPLVSTLAAIEHSRAYRMDFDTQVLVRLHWRGVKIISVPTKVVYPEEGVSNFRLWRDNIQISWMHTKLVFGMLIRLPIILYRKLNRKLDE